MKRYLLVVLLLVTLSSHSQNKVIPPTPTESVDLSGTWYGSYQLPSGTTYRMSMVIIQDKDDNLTGYQYWPEFYNSKSSIEGKVTDSEIILIEKELTQGAQMVMSAAVEVQYLAADTLILTSLDRNKQIRGVSELVRGSSMEENEIQDFQALSRECAEKYGSPKITGVYKELNLNELIQLNKKPFAGKEVAANNIRSLGSATRGQVQFKFNSFSKGPDKYLYELKSEELLILEARNDSVGWSYNGLDDQVYLYNIDELEAWLSHGFDELDTQDCHNVTMHHVQLDSIPAIRIYMEDDKRNWMVFYIDKTNYLVVRRESEYGLESFQHHKTFDGFPVATKVVNTSLDQVNTYHLGHIQFGAILSDSIFEIPQYLLSKIEKTPEKDHKYYDALGDEEFRNGNYEAASEAYSLAINQSRATNYYMKRGEARLEIDQYYEAISDFTTVLDSEPANVKAFNNRGLAKYYLKDYTSAIKDYDQAIRLNPTYISALSNRLFASFKLKEYESAVLDAEHLVLEAPGEGKYHLYYGVSLAQTGDYKKALIHYGKALNLGYSEEGLHNYKGVSHYALEQYDSAVVHFNEAQISDSSNTKILTNLANSYFQLEQYEKVVNSMQRALQIDPENHGFMNDLGFALQYVEDYEGSVIALSNAIKLHKQDADYFENRAEAYYSLGKYMESLEDLNTCIDLNTTSGNAFYKRGLVKVTMNNKFDACRDFQKAHELGVEEAPSKIAEYCISTGNPDQ